MREIDQCSLELVPSVTARPGRRQWTPSRFRHGTSTLRQAFLLLCLIAVIDSQQSQAAEWSLLGLEGRFVNALTQCDGLLYSATDNGIYRRDFASQEAWVLLGLEGEDVRDLFIDPDTPDTLYAGIGLEIQTNPPPDVVTLYKSIDGGSTWLPSDNGIHGLSVRTVVGRPDNSSILYAHGIVHLSRSEDGSSSWTRLPNASGGFSFALAPSNPDVLYLGGGNLVGEPTLAKSIDGGDVWSSIGLPFSAGSISSVAVDPFDPDVVYGILGAGILKSVDGGDSISVIPVGLIMSALIIDPVISRRLYVGGRVVSPGLRAAVFQSRDRGETWTDLDGPGGDGGVTALLLNRNDSNVLYAGTNGIGVFMTDVSELTTSVNGMVWRGHK